MIGRAVNGYHSSVSTVLKSGNSPPSGAGGQTKPPALFYFDYYYYLYNTKKNRYDTFSIFRSRARHLLADRCVDCHHHIQMEGAFINNTGHSCYAVLFTLCAFCKVYRRRHCICYQESPEKAQMEKATRTSEKQS